MARKVRREEEPVTERRRVHRFRVKSGQERAASRLPCLSLDCGDDRQSTSGSRDVDLTIFIISVSCSKSLRSFTNSTLHFSRPQVLRWRLMQSKGMEDLAAFRVREERSSRGKRDKYSSAEGQ